MHRDRSDKRDLRQGKIDRSANLPSEEASRKQHTSEMMTSTPLTIRMRTVL